jgi:hypothetical protein
MQVEEDRMTDAQNEEMEFVRCPACGAKAAVEITPTETTDGNTLGVAEAHCSCGRYITEDEIYPGFRRIT